MTDLAPTELDLLRAEAQTLRDLLEVQEQTSREQLDTIRRQQVAIHELSTPILEVWKNILVLPIVGTIDARRCSTIMEHLLVAIVERQALAVIIDVTGVSVIDTETAGYFMKISRSVELLGTRCVLTGLRPAVAQTLVELGIDLGSVTTRRNLHQGLQECMRFLERSAGAAP